MQFLTMGANAPLDCDDVAVTLRWPTDGGVLDASIYMLGSDGRVRGDHDMIFYNQRSDPDRAVCIASITAGTTEVLLDLNCVPDPIDRIVICVTVEQPDRTMAKFVGTSVNIDGIGTEGICFEPDLSQASEVAMRMVEVYRRHGRWRIRAIGQGFNAGLDELARSFGVDVSSEEESSGDFAAAVEPPQPLQSEAQPEPKPVAHLSAPEHSPHNSCNVVDNDLLPIKPEAVDDSPLPSILPADSNRLSADRPEYVWQLTDIDVRAGLTIQMSWRSRLGGARGRARFLKLELGCFYQTVDGTRGIIQT